MDVLGLVTDDEVRLVAVPDEQVGQLLVWDPGEDRGVGDLVAVEMEDRDDRTVDRRVEELVRVPARRQRPGLRLAVADDAEDDEVRVVERGAVRVDEGVAQLAALVDRARRLRRHMTPDATRKRELPEEATHAVLVAGQVRVDL